MYKEINIELIKSNPQNPRTKFEGPKYEDLVNSIREKGVLEPILVRKINAHFEIVAGERRFRAQRQVFKEWQEKGEVTTTMLIPAIVRKLNDDEAFEIMIIENLQREDLTPLEEVQSFEKYVKQHGKEGIETLAQKTGIQQTYIRRRITALSLPKRALEAWSKGTLAFGHLEELIRLKDKQDLKEIIDRITVQGWRHMSVKDLRDHINSRIPLLTKAKFDMTECNSCMQNSDIQKELWDIEPMKKTHCLNPKCFRKKQVNYLKKNWLKTHYALHYKTTGFVFKEDVPWGGSNSFYNGGFKKCLDGCEKFKTIINLDGSTVEGKACVVDDKCYQSLSRSQQQETKKEKKENGSPRKSWHGQHFRELFFKERIPEQFKAFQPDDVKMLRAALYAMIKLEWNLEKTFLDMADVEHSHHNADEKDIFKTITKMEKDKLLQTIQTLSAETILSNDVDAEGRQLVADHIGIRLAKEWAPVDDFYQMKTIKELLEWGEKTGILENKKATRFLTETLKKKKFSALKKTELIQVFKEAGISLVGKVPDEILGKGKKETKK